MENGRLGYEGMYSYVTFYKVKINNISRTQNMYF